MKISKSRIEHADWSTINLETLRALPNVELTCGDRLSNSAGNDCAGDPPGYPSYFTQSVYSASGNNPHGDWEMVIRLDGICYGIQPDKWPEGIKSWEDFTASKDKLFESIWQPLPLKHPRTQAWLRATFSHHRHCYHLPEHRERNDWQKHMLIWPGGCMGKTPFGGLKDEDFEVEYAKKDKAFDRWTPAYQNEFIADIRSNNARITKMCEEVATPDNHDGTILVRRHYPEFQPTQELIKAKFAHPGNWWETLATQPTPEECPGQYDMVHPCNGSWCQFCGWHA